MTLLQTIAQDNKTFAISFENLSAQVAELNTCVNDLETPSMSTPPFQLNNNFTFQLKIMNKFTRPMLILRMYMVR